MDIKTIQHSSFYFIGAEIVDPKLRQGIPELTETRNKLRKLNQSPVSMQLVFTDNRNPILGFCSESKLESEFECIEIPESMWLCFSVHGKMSENATDDSIDFIFDEYRLECEYRFRNLPNIIDYLEINPNEDRCKFNVYIAVE